MKLEDLRAAMLRGDLCVVLSPGVGPKAPSADVSLESAMVAAATADAERSLDRQMEAHGAHCDCHVCVEAPAKVIPGDHRAGKVHRGVIMEMPGKTGELKVYKLAVIETGLMGGIPGVPLYSLLATYGRHGSVLRETFLVRDKRLEDVTSLFVGKIAAKKLKGYKTTSRGGSGW